MTVPDCPCRQWYATDAAGLDQLAIERLQVNRLDPLYRHRQVRLDLIGDQLGVPLASLAREIVSRPICQPSIEERGQRLFAGIDEHAA
jgi:hypothetical protein